MNLIKTPFWLRGLYPSYTWRKLNDTNTIYVTFDDGPIPNVTPFVLKTLKEFNARATFFCIGDNIRKHPDIFESVKKDGHSIGNHTFNHLKGCDTEDEIYVENFNSCMEQTRTNLFRPPYGRVRRSQVKKLRQLYPDLEVIMWDVLSGDFDLKLSPENCLENVIRTTRPGAIVVFHDSLKAFDRLEYTLPRALEYCKKQGYTFEALPMRAI